MIFYGRNVVIEALDSSLHEANKVFLQDKIKKDSKIHRIIKKAKDKGVTVEFLPRGDISKICKSEEHQGVAVGVEFRIQDISLEQSNGAFLYISEATFEHNIGAIIRSAEVAGFNGVIVPKQVQINAVIAKTSAGAIFHIPIHSESIYNAIKKFKNSNYLIYAIERDGQKYFDVDLTQNTLFIIGGEDKSISKPLRKKCDEILEIPQKGKVNSLNMSVATSIVMFERLRQIS